MSKLGIAINIASEVFKNKTDKGGHPYMLHCIRVMMGVQHLGEEAMIPAVLHDVIEDHPEGIEFAKQMLIDAGFSPEVILILELLTHRKETEYMSYIRALSVHPIAKAIKISDLRDNSDITRVKDLRQKDFDRLQKYIYAYKYLTD